MYKKFILIILTATILNAFDYGGHPKIKFTGNLTNISENRSYSKITIHTKKGYIKLKVKSHTIPSIKAMTKFKKQINGYCYEKKEEDLFYHECWMSPGR